MSSQKPIALYEVGDVVRVKSIEQLHKDLGNPIRAQCGWSNHMDRYTGREFMVVYRHESNSGGFHYSYKLSGAGNWYFSEDVLCENMSFRTEEARVSPMSYDDLMGSEAIQ